MVHYNRLNKIVVLFCIQMMISCSSPTDDENVVNINILRGSQLEAGYGMGVNSSEGRTDWLQDAGGYFRMSYPAGQTWGAVFITVGNPTQPPRPSKDFSAFKTLTVEMRGELGGEQVEIGIKSHSQPDDGREAKIPVTLTSQWVTYDFALNQFSGADLKNIYVAIEFVFAGTEAQIVYFRNVQYV